MMSPHCVHVCVYTTCISHGNTCTHIHTHSTNTTSITSLHYPSLDSVALFLSQNYHISGPPNTPHILCSQPIHNEQRNPSFGREEKGISSLSSSQRGNNCRESFTNWPLNLVNRQRNRSTREGERGWRKKNDRQGDRFTHSAFLCLCKCLCITVH